MPIPDVGPPMELAIDRPASPTGLQWDRVVSEMSLSGRSCTGSLCWVANWTAVTRLVERKGTDVSVDSVIVWSVPPGDVAPPLMVSMAHPVSVLAMPW